MQTDELALVLPPDLRRQVDALCAATNAPPALERLAGLASEPALAEVAQRAGNWEIRLAAAQRISDPQLLLRIVEATRHRDNRVFRHCSDLLRARRRSLGHAMRAAELAAGFRRMLATQADQEPLPVDRFDEFDAELNDLRQESSVPQECLDLAAAVRERIQRDAQAMRDLGADAAEAEGLRARAESAGPAEAEPLRERVRLIAERSARRVAWLAAHPTAAALEHSVQRAQAALDALAPKPKPKVAEPVPRVPVARKAKAAPAPATGERDAVRDLLDRLALQVEAGQLAEAEDTERQLVGKAGAGPLPESLQRRLRRERAQLERIRDWARWGNDQSRVQLIRSAEELLQGKREPDDLAAAVTGLREEWKRLDAIRRATQKQWQRFDAVLTRAFQPVLEFRARRANQEKAAAAAKASVCEQCEAWASGIDWQKPDLRAIAAQRRAFGEQWRALPFAGFRAERQLRKRFDQPLKAVDERLGAARQAEWTRREAQRTQRNARDQERTARVAERAAREAEANRKENERKEQAARRLDAARKRFATMARDSALAAAQADPATLDKGGFEREALLLDLELALDLPSPESAAGERRARQLLKLQERFRPGKTQGPDPEELVRRWYAAAARSDPQQDARMSVIVEALVKAGRPPAR
jgi:hypothetical protein